MGSRLIEHQHAAGRHVVDQLIEERAPTLVQRPAGRWLLRNLLYPWLGYRAAKAAIDGIQGMSGTAIMAHAEVEIGMRVRVLGRSRLPAKGRLVIAVNHPTGLADGIALWSALSPVRADLRILANQDALRIAPALAEVFIPVDWVTSRRTPAGSRRVLGEVARSLREEAALVFFPSGRIAHLRWRGLTERVWLPTVVTVARRFGAPIVPLHIRGRNSWLFYVLSLISRELRDVTLFHEILNKRGQRFELTVGLPLDPGDLPDDPGAAVGVLQRHVEVELPRASRVPPRIGSTGRHGLADAVPPTS
jgi:putative hemolysin